MTGYRSARQRVWEAIRAKPDEFVVSVISSELGISDFRVRECLRRWAGLGYLRVTEKRCGGKSATHYRLVKDEGIEAPPLKPPAQGGKEALRRIWNVLRIGAGGVDSRELSALARADLRTVRNYLGYLDAAGYLMTVPPEGYRLNPHKISGPRPPVIRTAKALFDPNLNLDVWVSPVRDQDVEGE
ncbi:MAG: hypothetical protein FWD77_08370 [Betaproteobacteria bacterium]|nr:hypothetical protein [Betaproteobacteria bacterium]